METATTRRTAPAVRRAAWGGRESGTWVLLTSAQRGLPSPSSLPHALPPADVAFFSGLAGSWQAAGQRERAKWCLERAMRYSQQVGASSALC